MDIPAQRKQLVVDYEAGKRDFSRIELSQVDLSEVNFSEANFSGSDLTNANLTAAILNKVNFMGTCLERATLTNSSLSEANFQGADLGGANLEGSNLAGATLSRSNLDGAKLMASNLSRVDLAQASLEGTSLEQVDLANANLEQTNLKSANLTDANLMGTNLGTALLEDAIYSEDTQFPDLFDPVAAGMRKAAVDSRVAGTLLEQYNNGKRDFRRINLSRIQMHQANLSEADLTAADLSEADLAATNLSKAVLRGTIFNSSNLKDANLTQADLRGASLENSRLINAILEGVNLGRADLSSANLLAARLARANFEQASLMGAVLTRADISDANMVQANLSQANLEEANLCGTNLKGANLTHANLKGAIYSKDTQFPIKFDPAKEGMTVREWSQPQLTQANVLDTNTYQTESTQSNINQIAMREDLKGRSSDLPTSTASNAKVQQNPSVLNLEVRLDISKLSRLLAEESWEDASVETMKLLLASCRQQNGKLDKQAIVAIPPEIIRAVDNLWSEFSHGRFSFQVQVKLLEDLRRGNPFNGFEEIFRLFLERVRWKLVHYRTSCLVKVEHGDTWVKGQFPVYLKHFLDRKNLGLAYVPNLEDLNCFWTHLRECFVETEERDK